jgi:hypothetical protein
MAMKKQKVMRSYWGLSWGLVISRQSSNLREMKKLTDLFL